MQISLSLSFSFPLLALLALTIPSQGAIALTGSSTLWTTIAGNYDYLSDQQTGAISGDILGDTQNPGFFTAFDSGSSLLSTDGTLAFRVRLDGAGGNNNTPQFDRVLWVGIDADLSGSIDVFIGVDRSGSSNTLGVYAPGTGLNTSPNTTTVATLAYYAEELNSTNFNYRAVTATDAVSVSGNSTDLSTASTGDVDYYLSFAVPFSQIVSFLGQQPTPGIPLTDLTAVRYVLATSTQDNSLNQDLGGVNGNTNSSTSWTTLGGFSPIVNATGQVQVPEPATATLLLLGMGALLCRRSAGRKQVCRPNPQA